MSDILLVTCPDMVAVLDEELYVEKIKRPSPYRHWYIAERSWVFPVWVGSSRLSFPLCGVPTKRKWNAPDTIWTVSDAMHNIIFSEHTVVTPNITALRDHLLFIPLPHGPVVSYRILADNVIKASTTMGFICFEKDLVLT